MKRSCNDIRWSALLACLLGGTCQTATAAAPELSELVGQPAFWQDFDWQHANNSSLWKNQRWINYLGSQPADSTRDKIQELMLDKLEWQAIIEHTEKPQRSPYQLTIYTPVTETDKDSCDILLAWASQHFGAPQLGIQGSYRLQSAAPSQQTIDRRYQWTLGNTRITEICNGRISRGLRDTPAQIWAESALRFAAADRTAALTPLLQASCSRVMHSIDNQGTTRALATMTFIIDRDHQLIRRNDLVPLKVDHLDINQLEARFDLVQGNATNRYRIDLNTGQLQAEIGITGIPVALVNGQCKMETLETPRH